MALSCFSGVFLLCFFEREREREASPSSSGVRLCLIAVGANLTC